MTIKIPRRIHDPRRERIRTRAENVQVLLHAHRMAYPDSTAPPVPDLAQIEAVLFANDRIERAKHDPVDTDPAHLAQQGGDADPG